MANEINLAYISGQTLYAIIKDAVGAFYNHTTQLFEAFAEANWEDYGLWLDELIAGTGQYFADFPALPGGVYGVEIYAQGSPTAVPADGPPVAAGSMQWNGEQEQSLAMLGEVPAVLGVVSASALPTPTTLTVTLDEPLASGAQAQSFQELVLTAMPGSKVGAPIMRPIAACTIVDPVTLQLVLGQALPIALSAGDPVSISG
jgi:hypothetical protein